MNDTLYVLSELLSILIPLASIISFLILRLRDEWTFKRIFVFFLCGVVVGFLGSFTTMDPGLLLVGWAPPLAFYIFYKGFKETLRLEVEDGDPPSLMEKTFILMGLFASSWMFLVLVSSFTFMLIVPQRLHHGLNYWMFLFLSQIVWFVIIYQMKIRSGLAPAFEKSFFDYKKYLLLYFGVICALLIFGDNLHALYIMTGV